MKLYMFETPQFEAGSGLSIRGFRYMRGTRETKIYSVVETVLWYCGYQSERYSFLCSDRNASPSGGAVRPLFLCLCVLNKKFLQDLG